MLTLALFGCTAETTEFKIMFTGDIMFDRGVERTIEENGIEYIFKQLTNVVGTNDFVVSNFEGTAIDSDLKAVNKRFVFKADPIILKELKEQGISHVSLANNHSLDYGEEGLKQTMINLQENKIEIIGGGLEGNECEPRVISSGDQKVAVFASTILKNESAKVCDMDEAQLSIEIEKFQLENPNTLVIIFLHWGIEYSSLPTNNQISMAHKLIESGADVIIGHHPHVVQPIEKYKKGLVFYSLGNFVFDNNTPPANRGLLLECSFRNNQIEEIYLVPIETARSRPSLMEMDESKEYLKTVKKMSPTVRIEQEKGKWRITN